MKINVKKFQYLSKISNSIFDDLKIEFLYHSNHIEGSTFTKDQLNKLLEEAKIEGEHTLDDILETRNSLDVFDKVIQTLNQPLTKHLLWDWHYILKKGTTDDEIHNIGNWKKYDNKLRGIDLKLSDPLEVDNLMFNLLEDWNEISSPTIKDIATFHYKFEKIHPFQDGNGRIGRFIILKQCIENDIDLIAIDNEYNKSYREALYQAQTTDDISLLVDVFQKCQIRLDEKLQSYNNLLNQLNEELEDPDTGDDMEL